MIKETSRSSLSIRRIGLGLLLLAPVLNFASVAFSPVSQRSGTNFQTYIDAAGYAFSIWGFIFLWMIWYGIFQLGKDRVESPYLYKASWGILLAALALNLFVPVSMMGNKLLTWFVILLHLIPLIISYRALRKQYPLERSAKAKWVYGGVSVFMGWISAAFVISTTQTLIYLGINGIDTLAKFCTLALILILAGIAIYLFMKQQDGLFVLTVVWALAGIAVEQWAVPVLAYTALAAAVCLLLLVVIRLRKGLSAALLPDVYG